MNLSYLASTTSLDNIPTYTAPPDECPSHTRAFSSLYSMISKSQNKYSDLNTFLQKEKSTTPPIEPVKSKTQQKRKTILKKKV